MRTRLIRALPWVLGLCVLAVGAGVIGRGLLHKRKAPPPPPPHWPVAKDRSDADMYRAMELQNAGKWDEALSAYGRILEKNPDDWLARGGRVACYKALG
ncbi:MAG: hypothetical protein ACREN5_09520, partial [Gemmatimonadales bacterium]